MKNGIENGYYHEITPGGYGIAIKAGKVLFSPVVVLYRIYYSFFLIVAML